MPTVGRAPVVGMIVRFFCTAEFSVAQDPQESFIRELQAHLLGEAGVAPDATAPSELLRAVARSVRTELARRQIATLQRERASGQRRVHYLSMEFLIGRSLGNALAALELDPVVRATLQARAVRLEQVADSEVDPGLGNGGLGRLAACFLDSMATLGVPSMGYGIRYEYGMFAQTIAAGEQIERPDPWLADGHPWEFPRRGLDCRVCFGGRVEHATGRAVWHPAGEVLARAYDVIIPGHGTESVSTLRLWRAAAPESLDLSTFNSGDYARAAAVKNQYENISWVLYPNDSTPAGRELRLRQEYFFVAASLEDILRDHLAEHGSLETLADQIAIHLNDTHPAIGVAELQRRLHDEFDLPWERAWQITRQVFSYTNHTLMPEALETWPVELLGHVLPRHLEIIYRINQELLDLAAQRYPGDLDLLARLSLIDEQGERRVRMAHLSIVGSQRVNGVSELHSDLLVQTIFHDFARLWPERFTNVTNGVTPRRWLAQSNTALAGLIDDTLGVAWRADFERLADLAPQAEDAGFREAFRRVKQANKQALARWLAIEHGMTVDPESLFDVHIKRVHEYKRQLLNVLHVVTRYQTMIAYPQLDWTPRTVIFAGKAASSYAMAKSIIRLIHDVARTIDADPRVAGRLRVVFVPNYGVSIAEKIIPAAELSQQISTAGTEASGTGNMKLALNGALTLGTEDGANIEIRQAVGDAHLFVFGLRTPEVAAVRRNGYQPMTLYTANEPLRNALDAIAGGAFSPDDPERHRGIVNALLWGGDHYLVLADYDAYIAAQQRIDQAYRTRASWDRSSIITVAAMGRFSSDRSIREYAERIWRVTPRH